MTGSWSFAGTMARRVGKTTALARITKDLDGTLVCLNEAAARETAREYGCRTVGITIPDRLRGTRCGPLFFEPEAVGAICADYEREVDQHLATIKALREEVARWEAAAEKSIANSDRLLALVEHLGSKITAARSALADTTAG